MKHIKLYQTEDAFVAEKDSLLKPYVTLTKDDNEVHFGAIKSVKITLQTQNQQTRTITVLTTNGPLLTRRGSIVTYEIECPIVTIGDKTGILVMVNGWGSQNAIMSPVTSKMLIYAPKAGALGFPAVTEIDYDNEYDFKLGVLLDMSVTQLTIGQYQ